MSVEITAPDPDVIRRAAAILRAGGLVGIPTETVYGLAGRALDPRALARIFEAKGRPRSHPLIAHVLGEAEARGLSSDFTASASLLAKAFWPGPLTLVVARHPSVPAEIAEGGDSIAIRAPSHPVARALLVEMGEPLAAPSANRYQQLSPTTAAHVQRSLGSRVDLILDAGPCEAGIESTVVDVRGAVARVLRPGAISIAELRKILPHVEGGAATAEAGAVRASPGMDEKHYAPRARLVLVEGRAEAVQVAASLAGSAKVGLLLLSDDAATSPDFDRLVVREMPTTARAYAHLLFAALHELDQRGVAAIVVEGVPSDDEWHAVSDRLRRASSK